MKRLEINLRSYHWSTLKETARSKGKELKFKNKKLKEHTTCTVSKGLYLNLISMGLFPDPENAMKINDQPDKRPRDQALPLSASKY